MVDTDLDYMKLERTSHLDELFKEYEKKFDNAGSFYQMTMATHTLAILNNSANKENENKINQRINLEVKKHSNEHSEAVGNNWSSLGLGGVKVVSLVLQLKPELKDAANIVTHTADFAGNVQNSKKDQFVNTLSYNIRAKQSITDNSSMDKRQENERVQSAFQRAQGTDQKENETKTAMLRQ